MEFDGRNKAKACFLEASRAEVRERLKDQQQHDRTIASSLMKWKRAFHSVMIQMMMLWCHQTMHAIPQYEILFLWNLDEIDWLLCKNSLFWGGENEYNKLH